MPSCLASGGRFGDKLNPINLALLFDTPGSRLVLGDAIADFDLLAIANEEPVGGSAVAWKLTVMLLQPNTRHAQAVLRHWKRRAD